MALDAERYPHSARESVGFFTEQMIASLEAGIVAPRIIPASRTPRPASPN